MLTTAATKSLMMPKRGQWPSFQDIVDIVSVGSRFDLSICIVCFSQNVLGQWQTLLNETAAPKVTLVDGSGTSLAELRHYLAANETDMTVLSGVRAAIMANRVTTMFVGWLITAVPAGIIITA